MHLWETRTALSVQTGIISKGTFKKKLRTTVFKMFCDDLCTLLQDWQTQGERIILLMDTNNNVHNGKLSRRLAGDLIQMKEAVHEVTRGQGTKTHIRGSVPIDRIWHTPKLLLQGASYLPFDRVLGNHWPVVADFIEATVLGINLPKVLAPEARKLNSKVDRIREPYIEHTETSFKQAKILEHLRVTRLDTTGPNVQ